MKQKKQHLKKSGIYCIRNLTNNKIYIGKAKCIYSRIKDHITRLNTRSKDENPHLINSWHKYGRENFEYFVLEFCSEEELKSRELYWISVTGCLNRDKGYNLRLDSSDGLVVSKETREKMRKSRYKALEDPENRKKCSHNFWKNNPDKLKEMSEKVAKLNVRYSIEQCDKEGKVLKVWE